MPLEVPISPKILSPNAYSIKEIISPRVPSPQVARKIPSRRNFSDTSLDFSVVEKKTFEMGFESAPLGTPAVDFVPDGIVSSLVKQEL